jgi:hypothetical protein
MIGATVTALPPSASLLFDRNQSLEVELASSDFALDTTDLAAIASGANMALVGQEVVQFLEAEQIDARRWRLNGLLRGRGGTEPAAFSGCAAGSSFVLLGPEPVPLDRGKLGAATTIAAIGLADPAPVYAPLTNSGLTRRPLTPVHGTAVEQADGSIVLKWCRRARGSWLWLDGIDAALNEQREAYRVGIGDSDAPDVRWEVSTPSLEIDAAAWASAREAHLGKALWVRQVGTADLSPPLLLATIH